MVEMGIHDSGVGCVGARDESRRDQRNTRNSTHIVRKRETYSGSHGGRTRNDPK